MTGRGGSGSKAPGIVTGQCIARQILDPGGNGGPIDGVGGQIACRCKGGNLAVCVIGDCSGYGGRAGSSHRKVGGVDGCGVHRLTEGGVDGLVDRHTGGAIGRDVGYHGGWGRVRSHPGSKAPGKVIQHWIAGEVLGPGGNRGSKGGEGRQPAGWTKGRSGADGGVGHGACHRRRPLIQSKGSRGHR